MSKPLYPTFQEYHPSFRQIKTFGGALAPQLYTTEWTARHEPCKKFTKKQNIQFFQLSTPAISVASLPHRIIYVVNNNLKSPACYILGKFIRNSNLTYLDFQRLENLAQLLKVVWVKTQDPTVFDKANIRAITNEKVWEHSENKVWRTRHFSQREGPSVQFFFRTTANKLFGTTSVSRYSTSLGRLPRQADTVQCPAQTKQKMKNITLLLLWLNGELLESSDSNRSASTGLTLHLLCQCSF